jgi:hypothetical protein
MLAHGFERYSAALPPYSARHREHLERGAEITARGSSPRDEVQVRTVGLIDFEVRIGDGVPRRHGEQEFMPLADTAMMDLQANYQQLLAGLRHDLHLKYKDREQ